MNRWVIKASVLQYPSIVLAQYPNSMPQETLVSTNPTQSFGFTGRKCRRRCQKGPTEPFDLASIYASRFLFRESALLYADAAIGLLPLEVLSKLFFWLSFLRSPH